MSAGAQKAEVTDCSEEGVEAAAAGDSLAVKTGFRSLHYDPDSGFAMNGLPYKVRGFCDHNDLAAVGMAVPDRLNLFRAQGINPTPLNSLFLGHFSPVLRRLFTVLSRFPASWRQDGENGRRMA